MKRIERVFHAICGEWEGKTVEILKDKEGTSASELAAILGLTRANTSFELNNLVRQEKVVKVKTYPVRYIPVSFLEGIGVEGLDKRRNELVFETVADVIDSNTAIPEPTETTIKLNPFDAIIGSDDSLKSVISQAKAAVYYPPHGLHMLLLGPTGSGKTFLANKIYQYALYENLVPEGAPFETFNCADYYHNPQLLLSQLFGYTAGSFTGATEDRPGLVEKANHGILLLDEIHRLTPEGQEMLFYFIDHGLFNRLGENGPKRKASVLIICATTENPSSALLETFLRRIPMVIQIPALKDRSIKERVALTKFLFGNEAKRINKTFRIDIDVINALVQTIDYGNVGQLKSQIQLVCAQAFLNHLHQDRDITIRITDLPDDMRGQWASSSEAIQKSKDLTKYVDVTTTIYPDSQPIQLEDEMGDLNIYELIEEKVDILEKEGFSKDQIHQYILTDLHLHVRKFVSNRSINYNLLKFVDPIISKLTIELQQIAEEKLNCSFDRRFMYYIGMHLDAFYRKRHKQPTIDELDVKQFVTEHQDEYRVAELFSKVITERLGRPFPNVEIVYLAMLLVSIETLDEKSKVSILVVAHGNSTAKSMVQVATDLLGSAPIVALDMPLTVSPEQMFEQLVYQIKELKSESGLLMLVDMGSLAMMERRLSQATHVPIKTISNVTTSLVLDVVRKVNYMDLDLTGIYNSVIKDFVSSLQMGERSFGRAKAIVSICSSGQGTAKKIEEMLNGLIYEVTDDSIKVVTISALHLGREIEKLQRDYDIIASVGTKNPKIDAPYISLEQLIEGSGEKHLRRIMGLKTDNKQHHQNKNIIARDLCEDTLTMHLVYLNPKMITDLLIDWTNELQIELDTQFSNTKLLKLIVHTAFAFERVLKDNQLDYKDSLKDELLVAKGVVAKTIITVEKQLNLSLTEDEILYISEVVLDD